MRATGRNIYITDLRKVLADTGDVDQFVTRCQSARFSAIWVRLARGVQLDRNFTLAEMSGLRQQLANVNVGLWGWHVPFCANAQAAADEASKVANWAEQFQLDGVLMDAEKTAESPRFRGGVREAEIYAGTLGAALAARGRGCALSSHDQPSLHRDLPFDVFLKYAADNCPQVYYRSADVATRFNRSTRDYQPLETTRDFTDRYKPTGNITMTEDLPLPDVDTCLQAAHNFLALVHAGRYTGYSFWCLDTAPGEIWDFFRDTPV
jgi:hypothetical protein